MKLERQKRLLEEAHQQLAEKIAKETEKRNKRERVDEEKKRASERSNLSRRSGRVPMSLQDQGSNLQSQHLSQAQPSAAQRQS